MRQLVKFTDKTTLSLCDFHIAQLNQPYKLKGKTENDCVQCPLKPETVYPVTRKIWVAVLTHPDRPRNDFVKVFCTDCLDRYYEFQSFNVKTKHATQTYPCAGCGFRV